MTLTEYGAWFTAFSETMGSPPGMERWNVIKKRVAEIDGMATTRELYEKRYGHLPPEIKNAGEFDPIAAMDALGKMESARFDAQGEE